MQNSGYKYEYKLLFKFVTHYFILERLSENTYNYPLSFVKINPLK